MRARKNRNPESVSARNKDSEEFSKLLTGKKVTRSCVKATSQIVIERQHFLFAKRRAGGTVLRTRGCVFWSLLSIYRFFAVVGRWRPGFPRRERRDVASVCELENICGIVSAAGSGFVAVDSDCVWCMSDQWPVCEKVPSRRGPAFTASGGCSQHLCGCA